MTKSRVDAAREKARAHYLLSSDEYMAHMVRQYLEHMARQEGLSDEYIKDFITDDLVSQGIRVLQDTGDLNAIFVAQEEETEEDKEQ